MRKLNARQSFKLAQIVLPEGQGGPPFVKIIKYIVSALNLIGGVVQNSLGDIPAHLEPRQACPARAS